MAVGAKAARKPMFVFTLERGLVRLRENAPALAPLFQFPPRIGNRIDTAPMFFPCGVCYCFIALIHPPSMAPISESIFDHISYFFIGR